MAMVLTGRRPAVQTGQAEERPDSEVTEKARRRWFTADYKLKVLAEADRAPSPDRLVGLDGFRVLDVAESDGEVDPQ
ncbi:MAG: hypothetical protein ACRDXD_04235 [Acidimicrobiia bacterium]